jgi:phage pi2 protein 07
LTLPERAGIKLLVPETQILVTKKNWRNQCYTLTTILIDQA